MRQAPAHVTFEIPKADRIRGIVEVPQSLRSIIGFKGDTCSLNTDSFVVTGGPVLLTCAAASVFLEKRHGSNRSIEYITALEKSEEVSASLRTSEMNVATIRL